MSIATLMRHEATDAVKEITGLDGGPIVADDVAAPKADVLAIDLIDPAKPDGKTLHDKVLGYAVGRLEASEKVMTVFHPRWNKAEKVMQAYIKRDIDEETNKVLNDENGPVKMAEIVVPYAYATVQTIVTYLMHTFCGRNPMFGIQGRNSAAVEPARMNEALLQYQIEHLRMQGILRRFFQDGEVYGLQILRTACIS